MRILFSILEKKIQQSKCITKRRAQIYDINIYKYITTEKWNPHRATIKFIKR